MEFACPYWGLPGDQQRAGSLKTSCWSCDPTPSVSAPTMLVTVINMIAWKMHNYNKKCVHSEARGVGICRLGRASKLLGSCLANIDTALEPLCESIDGQRRVNDVCFMMSSFAAPDMLATCLRCEMSNLRPADRIGWCSLQPQYAHTGSRRSPPRCAFIQEYLLQENMHKKNR